MTCGSSWFHRFPVSQEISQLVFDNHSQSLRIFHVAQPSSLSDGWTFSKSPNTQNLESIELRNLVSHNSISIIHALVNANSDTLASLTLGKEKHKFLNFADDDVDYLSGLDWNGEDLQLRCLGATSITLRSLMNDSFDPYVKFRMLRRLSLESCPRSQEFMLKMSEFAIDSTRGTPLPRLQEFVFRYEKPSEGLIQALESFLFTLPGLTLLSVLLEKAFRLPDITCILNHHAASLKILVWEGRTGPRLRSCEDTSFSVGTFGESNSKLSKICQSCKGLIELGIAFDWKDADMVSVPSPQRRATNIDRALSTLGSLSFRISKPSIFAMLPSRKLRLVPAATRICPVAWQHISFSLTLGSILMKTRGQSLTSRLSSLARWSLVTVGIWNTMHQRHPPPPKEDTQFGTALESSQLSVRQANWASLVSLLTRGSSPASRTYVRT